MPKHRIAIIGRTQQGNFGHGLDRVWLDVPGCEIVGVADIHKIGLAGELARLKLDEGKGYLDWREMLKKTKPDIVSICQRWLDHHAEMAVAAAEAGAKGIYLEKPMCRTLIEADAIVAACEKHNTKLAIAFQTRYSPKLEVVAKLIEAGRIGDVLELRGRGKDDRRGGGEDLWVLGTHVFNLINHFAGDPVWCTAQIKQDGEPVTKKHVRDGAEGIGPLAGDRVDATYRMSSGATAFFNSAKNAAGNPSRFGLTIYGSKGVLEIRTGHLPDVQLLEDPSWSPGRSGKQWQPVSTAGVGKPEPLKDGGLHAGNVLAVKDLIDAIENDRQPLANMYEARTSTEMIVAAFESHRKGGCPVKFPLENRENPLGMLGDAS